MQLATDLTDFSEGNIGLVELASSYLNDRDQRQWSKSEKVVYINEEQYALAAIINTFHEAFFLESATTPMVNGQSLYAMPADVARLIGLEVGDSVADTEPVPLVEIPLTDQYFYSRLADANRKEDYGMFFIQGSNFKIQPGQTSTTDYIRIHYVERLVRMTNNADESKIPAQHHELLAFGCVIRALAKKSQRNAAIEGLYGSRLKGMKDELSRFSPNREISTTPWWGSYGPDWPARKLLLD